MLVGSGNPEEGELRPQLLDRFGLSVEVASPTDIDARIEVIRRRDAYESDHAAFMERWRAADARPARRPSSTRARAWRSVVVPEAALRDCATLCVALGSDGLRGELTLIRAARALAAHDGAASVDRGQLRALAASAMRHRLRRDPLDEAGSTARVMRVVEEVLP